MTYCFADLTAACHDEWRAYIEHSFVRQLGDGTLPQDAFRHYLKQDYLFLIHFGRAYALATYKSRDITELRHSLAGLRTLIDVELGLRSDTRPQWATTKEDPAALPDPGPPRAHTPYPLRPGNRDDAPALRVAL